jgi:hypothetical protein
LPSRVAGLDDPVETNDKQTAIMTVADQHLIPGIR